MVLPATEIYHDISIVLYYICYIILYITYIHIMFSLVWACGLTAQALPPLRGLLDVWASL